MMKEGLSLSSVTQEPRSKAGEKGLEQAKPYLERSPKVEQLVGKNTKELKQENVDKLYVKIKEAVQSGSTENFEEYGARRYIHVS